MYLSAIFDMLKTITMTKEDLFVLKLNTTMLLSLTLLTSFGLSACQPSAENTPPPTTDNPQAQAPIVIHKARLSPDSSQVLVHLLQRKGEVIKPGETPESPNLQQAIQVCQTKDGSCKLVQSWTTFPSSLSSDGSPWPGA